MTFRVGQLVVSLVDGKTTPIKKGDIFTIRGMMPDFEFVDVVDLGLLFEEIRRAPIGRYTDPPFAARWFRPVVTPSIEVFTAMLTPSKQSERV